ncbi:MAG: hypothetical protein IPK16_03610 [Anaerolineales bacterium]|nr:hypothetical protein [Anaerolineales bacterium]
MNSTVQHRTRNLVLLAALLLAILPGLANVQTAQAEGRHISSPNEPSADAGGEIVYVDNTGVIRVLDPYWEGSPSTTKQVQWFSPISGFRNVALGDFDNDKDLEIVGITGTDDATSFIYVYDPVVAKGAGVPDKINGIPWKRMAVIDLPAAPIAVAAGNFDPNVPGDEIFVVRNVAASDSTDDETVGVIYKQTNTSTPDGTSWTIHFTRTFENDYERIAVGNADGKGGDELVLIEDSVKIEAFQPDQGFKRILEHGSDCRPPKDAAFAKYFGGTTPELMMVRKQRCSGSGKQEALAYFPWDGTAGQYVENASPIAYFDPEPGTIFTGDINGSGDDEAFLIRKGEGVAEAKRFFVRGAGNDGIFQEFFDGLTLDSDDGYREGAAGDIDGDGKAEPVLIRDNNIRYFPDAHTSAIAINVPVATDKRSIAIGDLDRGGFISGPAFGASVSKLDLTVKWGYITTGSFTIKNVATESGIPFVLTVDGAPTWLTVTPVFGTAPGVSQGALTVNYTLDARALSPGPYVTNLQFTANDSSVTNSPYRIPVNVQVTIPTLAATPNGVQLVLPSCQTTGEIQLDFAVTGILGNAVTAQIQGAGAMRGATLVGDIADPTFTDQGVILRDIAGNEAIIDSLATATRSMDDTPASITDAITLPVTAAPWITAFTAVTTTTPTTMTVTISPTLRLSDNNSASMILTANEFGQPANRFYPIGLRCVTSANYLPRLAK